MSVRAGPPLPGVKSRIYCMIARKKPLGDVGAAPKKAAERRLEKTMRKRADSLLFPKSALR